jgi:hypothetical protein
MSDFQQIVSNANTRLAQLQAMNSDIDGKIHSIIGAVPPGTSLSAQDVKTIQSLRASQNAILNSIQELALVTAAALDDSDAVSRLAASLATAIGALRAEIDVIAAISASCAQISAVCTGIDGIITDLKKLIGQ